MISAQKPLTSFKLRLCSTVGSRFMVLQRYEAQKEVRPVLVYEAERPFLKTKVKNKGKQRGTARARGSFYWDAGAKSGPKQYAGLTVTISELTERNGGFDCCPS